MAQRRGWDLLTFPAGRRAKYVVVLVWLAVVAVAGPFAGKLTGVEKNDASAYLPKSAESTKVNTELQTFPRGREVPGTAVYVAVSGRVTAADQALVQRQRNLVDRRVSDVRAGPVQVSPDGRALAFSFGVDQTDAKVIQADVEAVRGIVDGGGSLHAYVSGAAGLLVDSVKAFSGIDGVLLLVTGVVVIALLLLIYRSPVLWLLPILSVGGAIALAEGVVYALATHAGLVVSGQSGGILTVLIFGAGTDYALLLIARYREELHRHEDRHEAMAAALRRAGPAIVASASTVVLGLLCLLAAELESDRGLGPVGAVGIAGALLAQLTLLPALLVLVGRWVFWPADTHYDPDAAGPGESGVWSRIAGWIDRRHRVVWGATAAVLAVLAVGLVGLKPGLGQTDAFVRNVESVSGQQAYAAHFPAGGGAPTFVLVDAPAADRARAVTARLPEVATVVPVAAAHGRVELVAILRVDPDSAAAFTAIRQLRAELRAIPGAHARVGGQTATDYDVNAAAVHDRWVVMPLVLVVVMIVLGLLLRALVAPLVLAMTVVLSFAAALGVSGLVFDAIGFAGVDQSLPLLSYIFLVALGIDYNIFLMSRVHEEAGRRGTRAGTLTGLAVTGGVITSAGVVLAATFAALTVLPLVALVEIGFIVAFGVLLDTLIVRSILVPALTLEVDRRMWWPSRLARSDAGEREVSPAAAVR